MLHLQFCRMIIENRVTRYTRCDRSHVCKWNIALYIYDAPPGYRIESNVAHFSRIKRSSFRTRPTRPAHLHIAFWSGAYRFSSINRMRGTFIIHSLPIHCDRRCTDVYVRTPRHLTLDGEAFHCAVGHAFLRMPGWYAEVSSGMQRHPIFADRSRLRPREFRLLHTASQAAPAGFKSTPRAAASKSDTWFYPLRSLSSSSTIHRFSVALPKAFEKNPDSSPRRFRALSACFIRMDILSLP